MHYLLLLPIGEHGWCVLIKHRSFNQEESWLLVAVVMPVTLIAFIRLGLYRAVLRYIGSKVTIAILIGLSISVFTLVDGKFFHWVFFTSYYPPYLCGISIDFCRREPLCCPSNGNADP